MGSGRKELRDAGGLEATLDQPKRSSQTSTPCSHDNCIVCVVYHGIVTYESLHAEKEVEHYIA